MKLSVGVLYTANEILKFLPSNPMSEADFGSLFGRNWVASTEVAINIAIRCGWIVLDQRSILKTSLRGEEIVSQHDFQNSLRLQLEDYISSFRPSWGKLIPSGRSQTLQCVDPGIAQCFKEAGLTGMPPSIEVVAWWDKLASRSRGQRDDLLLEIGRRGELLSLAYERERVGNEPKWQSIENNSDGFDILSSISSSDDGRLTIEVKASILSANNATFFLTRNEWEFAEQAKEHCFHLWTQVETTPNILVVSPEQVRKHLPSDSGYGSWNVTQVPFYPFLNNNN